MTDWSAVKVRNTFIDYFCSKKSHTNVPSSPVVPYDDPTLLFSNSGMCQFKPIFLGHIDPRSDRAKWKRAANTQKCIRAGGKHNDLDDVGKDTYHHTFFEMLGNWSFGDYFQKEAIDWAWELLVHVYKLDPNRIYATYFGGDESEGLPPDNAAKELWKAYLPESRILAFGKKENFWEMGFTGPCGPCSEIHYDRIGGRDASKLVNADLPDVIEIWNLVFMQFNREDSGKLTELPSKHVDTGMGFERLTSILQNVNSNYDTDLFKPIFSKIQELTGTTPYTGKVGAEDADGHDTAYRIVADHIRTLTFALTDGARPGDKGRNFVLRRILRRAVRTGKDYFNAPNGFFHQLVDVVVDNFGDAFPELRKSPELVKKIIKDEETLFERSFQKGSNTFKRITSRIKAKGGDTINGHEALLLYTSCGFPIDLITIMSNEIGLKVDVKRFEELLEESRIRDQEAYAAKFASKNYSLSAAALSQLKEKKIANTVDLHKYDLEDVTATVQAIWQGYPEDGSFVDSFSNGICIIVLDKTNFYSYSGGQVADTGYISNDNLEINVVDVQLFGGYVGHVGNVTTGEVKVGDQVTCSVNNEKRRPIMSNHTSTHMLNWSIRELVDPTSDQRGSVVADDKFRFDFTCGQPVSRKLLEEVEKSVNDMISKNLPVYIMEVPTDEAKLIHGVRALFTEAYPNPVRVVSVGADIVEILKNKDSPDWKKFSLEFCGGTHIKNTGDAQLFTIISEESSSAGVRRIEAVTGEQAHLASQNGRQMDTLLEALLGLKDSENIKANQLSQQYLSFLKEFEGTPLISAHKKNRH